jgi:uncharacterized protein (TIGR00661 family)
LSRKGKNIIIAPLDWGLGHTSRCIPIIDNLLKKGHSVTAAVNDQQKSILQELFPTITYAHLEGYNIEYPVNGSMTWNMAKQSTKIFTAIKNENHWLKNYISDHPQDVVISDNRFGFYHPRVESIYITHQINIQGPSLIKPILYSIHKNYIDNFHHCVIPDTEDNILAGQLSKTPIDRFKFIGPISRFNTAATNDNIQYKYLGILSGPEPQRSVFCKILEEAFLESNEPCAIIGGKPLEKNHFTKDNLTYYPHLKTDEFYEVVCQSKGVISRSGYSTIMDFSILQKPIYFVPTPGQTEQEYLAEFHHENSGIGFCSQKNFSLNAVTFDNKLPFSTKVHEKIHNLLDII